MGRSRTAEAEPITTEIYLLRKQGLDWDGVAEHINKNMRRDVNPVTRQFCYARFNLHAAAIAKSRGEEYRRELYFPGKNRGRPRKKQAQVPEHDEEMMEELDEEKTKDEQKEEETKEERSEEAINQKRENSASMDEVEESMEETSEESYTSEEKSTIDGESTAVNVSQAGDDVDDVTDREVAILSAVSSVGAEFWQRVASQAGPDVTAAEAREVFLQRRFRKWAEASPLWAAASSGLGPENNGDMMES